MKRKSKTPALANWLASKLIDEKLLEEFLGDPEEMYEDRLVIELLNMQ